MCNRCQPTSNINAGPDCTKHTISRIFSKKQLGTLKNYRAWLYGYSTEICAVWKLQNKKKNTIWTHSWLSPVQEERFQERTMTSFTHTYTAWCQTLNDPDLTVTGWQDAKSFPPRHRVMNRSHFKEFRLKIYISFFFCLFWIRLNHSNLLRAGLNSQAACFNRGTFLCPTVMKHPLLSDFLLNGVQRQTGWDCSTLKTH